MKAEYNCTVLWQINTFDFKLKMENSTYLEWKNYIKWKKKIYIYIRDILTMQISCVEKTYRQPTSDSK